MNVDILKVAGAFALEGEPADARPYGSGHINDTFLVTTTAGREYVFQRLNTGVFTRPEELSESFVRVTEHLRRKIAAEGGDPARETLTLVPARDGKSFVRDESGFWRVTVNIENSFSIDLANGPEDVIECGRGFGQFMTRLADFPAETLAETIPNFHNTAWRIGNLMSAAREDVKGRLAECGDIFEKYASRAEAYAARYREMSETLPLRVTHNDTKINNILFDNTTKRALAVIDLDTVMPGLAAFDFGDAIRTGAATADEDTTDLDAMGVSVELFRAFARGYLTGATGLTDAERAAFVTGAKMMTYECGSRFLADFLAGDTYFRVSHPTHNLERAAAQMKLLEDMEAKSEELERIIREEAAR